MRNGDLRTAAVFPVAHPEDGVVWVGLRELLLRAHEFNDLALTIPAAEVGMLRVLYTIAARISGLDTVADDATMTEAWNAKRQTVLERGRFCADAVEEYLSAHEGRWDLFDPVRPWWQDPRLVEQAEAKSANVLDPTRPGDNSPVWWQHTHAGHAPPIPVAMALQWLLVHHYFGSGGTGGTRRVGTTASQHMSSGPLRAALVFSPLAPTLFETLIAGIPRPSTVDNPRAPDTAPWESSELNDPLDTPPPVSWPAGLLTGRSRHALLLVPDADQTHVVGCYLTWGWKPRHIPHPDPYTIIDAGNDGQWRHRQASSTRALWREVDALLADRPDSKRPDVLTSALFLPTALRDTLLVRAHGFDQDTKTVNRGWFTAVTPPLLAWMRENDWDRAEGAASLHQAAEDIAGVMNSALRTAYRSLGTGEPGRDKGKEVPWLAPAAAFYWPAAGTLFWDKVRAGEFDEPYRLYVRLAVDAVAEATRPQAHHPAVAREVATAQRYLLNFANKKNPRPPR
ncbi:type I-E CRISPR-associated protein Cse1/CasA [Actinokineospora sp. 24-640]